MGDCSYCKKRCGFGRSVHEECKIDHYESSIKRMDSGVGLLATATLDNSTASKNFAMTDLAAPDLEFLESKFTSSGGESWLWMQLKVNVYLAKPGEKILADDTKDLDQYKKCVLGISNQAIHILAIKSDGIQTSMRWPLSTIGEVSGWVGGSLDDNFGFRINMATSVSGQSDAFIVNLCTDEDFGRIYVDWIKRLVAGTSDQAPTQAPAQAPTQAQVTSVDPSTDVLIQDLLAKGKEQLINGDFGAAAKSVKAVIALDKDNAAAISILKAAESTGDSESKQVASPPDAQVETENDQDEFNPRSLCAWVKAIFGIIVIIIIVFWFFGDCSGDESESGDTEQSQERVYEGCDGLEDLIPKLKSVGGSSLKANVDRVTISLYQAVNHGNEAICNKLIEGWNKPENLKD